MQTESRENIKGNHRKTSWNGFCKTLKILVLYIHVHNLRRVDEAGDVFDDVTYILTYFTNTKCTLGIGMKLC